MVRATGTLAALVALLALGACGGDDGAAAPKTVTIDPTRVEKAIEVSVAEQSHRLSIVVCPTGIRRQKGRSFNCIATLSQGDKYPFRVTQKDNSGNVHYEQATGSTQGTTTAP